MTESTSQVQHPSEELTEIQREMFVRCMINDVSCSFSFYLFSFIGSPLQFYVDYMNSGNVSAYGPGLIHGTVNKPAVFTVNTKDAGEGKTQSHGSIHLAVCSSCCTDDTLLSARTEISLVSHAHQNTS